MNLCHNCSTPLLQDESIHEHYVNEQGMTVFQRPLQDEV